MSLTLEPSTHLPSVLIARVASDREVSLRVEDSDGERLRSVPASGEVPLIGLVAGEPFRLVPVVDGRDGEPLDAEAPTPPDGWPTFSLAVDAQVPSTRFLVVVTSDAMSGVGVLDGLGRWRWWHEAPPERTLASPRRTPDGRGVMFVSVDRERAGVDQLAGTVALDGSEAREVALEGAHHMAEAFADGTVAWMAWDTRIVPWLDGVPAPVTADRVLIGAGDGDAHERFSFFDDLGPATVPCEHGTYTVSRRGEATYEWTHANSLVWEPEQDLLLLGSRLLDNVVAVDRQTGALAWILGGEDATIDFETPEAAFSHAHFSDVGPDRVLWFDNGVHRDPPASRVLELELDRRAGLARMTREVPLPRYHAFLGDARWRDDGGLLVATAEPGTLTAYDASDRLVWHLELVGGHVLGRVRELTSFP